MYDRGGHTALPAVIVTGNNESRSVFGFQNIKVLLPVLFFLTLDFCLFNYAQMHLYPSFTQMIAMQAPAWGILFGLLYQGISYKPIAYVLLIPILCGGALTAYGEVSWNTIGYLEAQFGIICKVIRTVMTDEILKGSFFINHRGYLLFMDKLCDTVTCGRTNYYEKSRKRYDDIDQ